MEDDGLNLLPDTIRVARIRDEEEYEGVRVLLGARLANARIPLQIDVGFGDVITPGPIELEYPTLLSFPAPKLRAYSKASVVTLKPANGGQGKTGQRKWPGTKLFYPAASCGGKSVFVRQLRGPHLRTCP
ncbi:MAG: nucleotidyl transferase AbiEii/AbiGii toxin family protein [Acidobacteria bacterium]|nr:nucleotidyl transferase AbiEii/AbiGii toxin family protein [Acidobacteriota bacterium]